MPKSWVAHTVGQNRALTGHRGAVDRIKIMYFNLCLSNRCHPAQEAVIPHLGQPELVLGGP